MDSEKAQRAVALDAHVPHRTYNYDRIDTTRQTRIFVIYSGSRGDRIEGRLVNMDLSVQLEYEAISYVWRHKERNVPIKCDGFVLYTTQSTVQALDRVRSPERYRRIWIDSICINQDDLAERAQQVRNMGSIFGQADRVLVWLDRQEQHAMAAFQLIDDVHSAYGPANKLPGYPQPPYDAFGTGEHPFRARLDGPDGRCLAQVLSHEWFTRVWVLQEVGIAQNVTLLCGALDFPWDKVIFIHHFLRAKTLITWRSPLRTYARHIAIMTNPFWKEFNLDFLAILDRTRRCSATDPRDKVFALLSHPRALGVPVEINYRKPTVLVYRDLATTLLSGPSSLRVLSTVVRDGLSPFSLQNCSFRPGNEKYNGSDPKIENSTNEAVLHPTWVPDWRFDRMNTFDQNDRYNAGSSTQATFDLLENETVLRVGGLLFDFVVYQSQVLQYHEFITADVESVTEADYRDFVVDTWLEISNRETHSELYPDGKPSWLAYCETLTADHYYWFQRRQNHPLVSSTDLNVWLEIFCRQFESSGITSLIPDDDDEKEPHLIEVDRALRFFQEEVVVASQYRRVFVTSRGYYGLAPMNSQLGDCVCVFFGGRVPFLLRRHGDDFELVGECYVHGIMSGKAIGEIFKN